MQARLSVVAGILGFRRIDGHVHDTFRDLLGTALVPILCSDIPFYPRFPDISQGSRLFLPFAPFFWLRNGNTYSRCTFFSTYCLICLFLSSGRKGSAFG